MKKILVACGTGIATSTVVTLKLKDYLKENNINALVEQCKVSELPSKIDGADLIVTTTSFESDKVPVVRALSFLTGINMEADLERVLKVLRDDV